MLAENSTVAQARQEIRRRRPAEFDGGFLAGKGRKPPAGMPGGYPPGFHAWPLDRRNAWFCGFNAAYVKRGQA